MDLLEKVNVSHKMIVGRSGQTIESTWSLLEESGPTLLSRGELLGRVHEAQRHLKSLTEAIDLTFKLAWEAPTIDED